LLIGWREAERAGHTHNARRVGAPGRPYFRMLFVGCFKHLDGRHSIAWRCASLRQSLMPGQGETIPGHSTLARTRARLPLEVHDAVFVLALKAVIPGVIHWTRHFRPQ
jgi:hypothetical protein